MSNIRAFSGDYIAMANSTLQLAGWDVFYPSGQVRLGDEAPSGGLSSESHYYVGDWIGIRAIEDTYLFADNGDSVNSLQDYTFAELKNATWSVGYQKIMISEGDILYGRFKNVKVLKGLALGIRHAKAEPASEDIRTNSSGFYNPTDFPGCVARYDVGTLTANTTNEYGQCDAGGQILQLNNLQAGAYKNTSAGEEPFPDLVSRSKRKVGYGFSNDTPTIATDNSNQCADFNSANRQTLTLQYLDGIGGSQVQQLSRSGSPMTFVIAMKSDSNYTTNNGWGRHLFHADKGTGSGGATIANVRTGHGTFQAKSRWGFKSDENDLKSTDAASAVFTWQIHTFTWQSQADGSTKWYTKGCAHYENNTNRISEEAIYNVSPVGDDWKGLIVGGGDELYDFSVSQSGGAQDQSSIATELFFDGKIGEILIYNKVLSKFEREAVVAYMKDKWV